MTDNLINFKVTNKQSFIEFIELLREDLLKNPGTWENNNLADFLEAMARYTQDIQGYYDNTSQKISSDEPSWKVFADIFKGASIYE